MPHKSLRPCARHPWNLVSDGTGCPVCIGQPVLERSRPTDTRPSARARGYGYFTWKVKFRDPFIKAHPWCADPFGQHKTQRIPAVVVDHKIPKKKGGTDEWSNLQGLCRSCDNKKHYHDGSLGVGGSKSIQKDI